MDQNMSARGLMGLLVNASDSLITRQRLRFLAHVVALNSCFRTKTPIDSKRRRPRSSSQLSERRSGFIIPESKRSVIYHLLTRRLCRNYALITCLTTLPWENERLLFVSFTAEADFVEITRCSDFISQ